MIKKLKWAAVPILAVVLGSGLSSFVGAAEVNLKAYSASCPSPYSGTKITVCGEGSSYCNPSGTCP